ncbi:DUF3581 domain-containing protein [Motilimonas eburnea]|uniref:DUF3581 domain-containing protein n=1 Tax=Motilimonas eburnea TaxID=1737488 RepID=UPI001E3CE01D|nr:DUF3581 domain-containing protein [Motilimonas eburnea]MCE2570626.1 DUF3581 domain-containing protein [Motilimonas eburnea]
MFLSEFFTENNNQVLITPEQASHFAKGVAGDFNPLHDPSNKRFCVPGDLLFSMVLAKYGLSQRMSFNFAGMVGKDVALNFPDTDALSFDINDDNGKVYLAVEREGEVCHDAAVIEAMARNYVEFSGHNFPHILVPLMAEHNVMLNPERPLVIYDSMEFNLTHVNFSEPPKLELAESRLEVNGKRGVAYLIFDVKSAGEVVGTGSKKMMLSGLRAFDQAAIDAFCVQYLASRDNYSA